jgi:hypothetical protein
MSAKVFQVAIAVDLGIVEGFLITGLAAQLSIIPTCIFNYYQTPRNDKGLHTFFNH